MKIVKSLFKNLDTGLLTLFFMVFSFGQLQRIQLSNDLAFYWHDIIIAGFILKQFFNTSIIQQQLKNIPAIFKKIVSTYFVELLLIIWVFASMGLGALAGRVTIKGLLYLGRLIVYLLFVKLVSKNRRLAYSPSWGVAAVGLLIGCWGLLQYFTLPDTRFLFLFGWDNHYYRLIGTLFDPAFTGMMMVLAFGLLQSRNVFPQLATKLKSTFQLLLVVAIAATFSRASYLALLTFLSLQLLARNIKLKFVGVITLVFMSTLLLLPKPSGEGVNLARTSTGEARLANAQQGLSEIKGAQWLWGRGLFNNDVQQDYETPSHAQLPDSLPILILNSTGLGGALLALLVLTKWGFSWWKKAPVWTSLLAATLVHSLFNNTFFQPFIFLALWLSKNKTNT